MDSHLDKFCPLYEIRNIIGGKYWIFLCENMWMFTDIVSKELLGLFTTSAKLSKDEVIRKNWRSIACMSSGASCFSSVMPIKENDFNSFYDRLGFSVERETFAKEFLVTGDPGSTNHTISTQRHGGRCMFLGWSGYFKCDTWKSRPAVCQEYFCFEMSNFDKWQKGEDQTTFDNEDDPADINIWISNFSLLLKKTGIRVAPVVFFQTNTAAILACIRRRLQKVFKNTTNQNITPFN